MKNPLGLVLIGVSALWSADAPRPPKVTLEMLFRQAIDRNLAALPRVGIEAPWTSWPKEWSPQYDGPTDSFEALVDAKLLSVERIPDPHWAKNPLRSYRFDLTEEGKKFFFDSLTFSWATRVVDKIVDWDPQGTPHFATGNSVVFTYKLVDIEPWALLPGVQAQYPEIRKELDGVGKERVGCLLVLRHSGWEAQGYGPARPLVQRPHW